MVCLGLETLCSSIDLRPPNYSLIDGLTSTTLGCWLTEEGSYSVVIGSVGPLAVAIRAMSLAE